MGKLRIRDPRERSYTVCTMPFDIGYYNAGGGTLLRTHKFMIVSARHWIEEDQDFEHDVITAYPIYSRWGG